MKVNIKGLAAWTTGVTLVMDSQEVKADQTYLRFYDVSKATISEMFKQHMNPKTLCVHGHSTTSWRFETLFEGKGWRILQPVQNVYQVFYDQEIHVEQDKYLKRAYLIVDNQNRTAPYATLRFKGFNKPSELKAHLKDVFDSFPNDACRDAVNHIQLLEILAERNQSVVVYVHNA